MGIAVDRDVFLVGIYARNSLGNSAAGLGASNAPLEQDSRTDSRA